MVCAGGARALAVLVCLLTASSTMAEDSVARAQAYLRASQLPGGAFAGIPLIDGAEAAAVLGDQAATDLALFALAEERPDNSEAAFVRAHVLLPTLYSDPVVLQGLMTALAQGDVGLAPGWNDGDPILVARALRFAVDAPASLAFGLFDPATLETQTLSARAVIVPKLLARLGPAQRPDGGFGFADEGSDVAVTAEVASVLAALPEEAPAVSMLHGARAWLAGQGCQAAGLATSDLALCVLALSGSASDVQALSTTLAARQELDGSFEGDVRSTALAIRALTATLPNLGVTVSAIAQNRVGVGQQVTIPVQVTNSAGAASPATALRYEVLTATGTLALSGLVEVPAIAGGASRQVTVAFTAPSATGSHTVQLLVNAGQAFQEGSFEDNLLAFALTVTGPPDLILEPVDISVGPAPVAFSGSRVAVRVRNVGEAMAEDVHVQLFAGAPESGGTLIGETVLNAVAAGVPRRLEATVVPRTVGPLVLVARVDPASAIPESNETNNRAELVVTPLAPDEFQSDARAGLGGNPTSVPQGSDGLVIRYSGVLTFWRFGLPYGVADQIPFDEVPLALYRVLDDGTAVELVRQMVAFELVKEFTYPLPADLAPGTYTFRAVIDPEGIGNERTPSDNRAEHTLVVTNPGLAELMFVPGSVRADAPVVDATHPTVARAKVRNTGLATATDIPVRVAFALRQEWRTIAALAPGDEAEIEVPVGAEDVHNAPLVSFDIDPMSVISESSKDNNSQSITIRSNGLAVRISEVAVSPSPVRPGESAVVSMLLTNVGVARVSTSIIEVYDGGVHLASHSETTGFDPGQAIVGSVTLPPSTYTSDRVLRTRIPGLADFVEFPLAVASPDFAVASRGILVQRTSDQGGEVLTPTVVVDNLGSATAATSVRLYRGYPSSGDLVGSGTIEVPAGGAAVFASPGFSMPSAPPFVLTAVLDEEEARVEADETNNVATRPIEKQAGDVVVAIDETNQAEYTIGLGQKWVEDTEVMPEHRPSRAGNSAPPGTLADFAQDLAARGYEVRGIAPGDGGLTASKLRDVDVLVQLLYANTRSEPEILAEQEFVASGGGLWLLGDHKVPDAYWWWGAAEQQLDEAFGVQPARVSLVEGAFHCSAVRQNFDASEGNILTHPITSGVNTIQLDLVGGYSGLPDGAAVLVKSGPSWNYPDIPVSAAFSYGVGRVVVHADSSILGSWYWADPMVGCDGGVNYRLWDNRRFALQTIDWLANEAELDYPPDLAFTPASIALSNASPVAGEAVEARATVRNIGGALRSPGPTAVRFYDGEPGAAVVLGEAAVPDLAVDQSFEVVLRWDTTHAAGAHQLFAVIDAEGAIAEYSETNNRISVPVRVRSSTDLRVDGPDLSLTPGTPPTMAVRVHNVGYASSPAGTSLRLRAVDAGGGRPLGTLEMPEVPARSAVTVTAAWPGELPSGAFTIEAAVDPEGRLVDPDRTTNAATMAFEPPALSIQAPLPSTRWGGVRRVRWTASSDTRPTLNCFVSFGRAGGALTGLGSAKDSLDVDTTRYADGEYVVRVTASDGLQSTSHDVPITIANAGTVVRTFSGAATWSAGSTGGQATVLVPAGARVTGASVTLDVTGDASVPMGGTWPQDPYGGHLVEYRGRLHSIYTRDRVLYEQVSDDAGATWSSPAQLSQPGEQVHWHGTDVNAFGIHQAYELYETLPRVYARRNQDGRTWSPAVTLGTVSQRSELSLHAGDEGVALVGAPGGRLTVATADASGGTWTALSTLDTGGLHANAIRAVVAGAKLRVAAGTGSNPTTSFIYREVPVERQADLAAWSTPITLSQGTPINFRMESMGERVHLAYQIYGVSSLWLQQCKDLSRCAELEGWLQEPALYPWPEAAIGSVLQERVQDRIRMVWYWAGDWYAADVLRSGEQHGGYQLTDGTFGTSTYGAFSAGHDYLGFAGSVSNRFGYARYPHLTPHEAALDVGADGIAEAARAGMPGNAHQVQDFSDALNAYLASHTDADDGTVDGQLAVPFVVSGLGAGGLVLRNLEVTYESGANLAAWAQPRLFSPGASPGVMDTTLLSLSSGTAVTVRTAAGVPVRTLSLVANGGRQEAVFDGRSDAGTLLPSAPYLFDAGGELEVDDVAPVVALEAGGVYGGTQEVRGTATDRDYAGSDKNFSRYLLEYTLDGTTYVAIASGTSPVAPGVLGRWNTNGLPVGAATLRLTAWDKAGNRESVTRSVSTDASAPDAPVIATPTDAEHPMDLLASTVTIGGTAEPNVSVTVELDGEAVGTVTADGGGRWSLADVAVPSGTSSVVAFAERGGVRGPASTAITIARYALSLVIQDLPPTAARGATVPLMLVVSRTSVEARDLTIRVRVVDGAGRDAAMTVTPADSVVSLSGSGTASFQAQVSTGLAPEGNYRVVAQAIAGQRAPAIAMEPLTLEAQVRVAARLTSDKAVYDPLQAVTLTSVVTNAATSRELALTGEITLYGPDGSVTVIGPVDFGVLSAGRQVVRSSAFAPGILASGTYLADLALVDELARPVAIASTSFDVQAQSMAALSGTLQLTPAEYQPGDGLAAAYTLTNGGAFASVATRVMLVTPATGTIVGQVDEAVSLAREETVARQVALSTTSADGTELLGLLLGNGQVLAADTVAPTPWRDTTGPLIAVTGVLDGEYRNSPVTPVVTITDDSPFTSMVTLGGMPFVSGTVISTDGTRALAVAAEDVHGNSSTAGLTFTIDQIPPVVVASISEGATYAAPVTLAFSATDLHLESFVSRLDGAPVTSGETLVAAGPHVLSLVARDRAGNETARTISFQVTASAGFEVATQVGGAGKRVLTYILERDGANGPRAVALRDLVGSSVAAGGTVANVLDASALSAAIRSDAYDTFVIGRIDAEGSSTGPLMTELTGYELGSAVFRGKGLLFIQDFAHQWYFTDYPLGVWFHSDQPAGTVHLNASAFCSQGNVATPGGVKLGIMSASTVGTWPPGTTAVSSNAFGLGAAVVLGFDPVTATPQSLAHPLVRDGLAFVAPDQVTFLPRGTMPVAVKVKNLGAPSEVRVEETLAPALTIASVLDGGTVTGTSGISWSRTLDTDAEATLRYVVRLPVTAGAYPVATKVYAVSGSGESLESTSSTELTLGEGASELMTQARTLAEQLPVAGANGTHRANILNSLDWLVAYEVGGVTTEEKEWGIQQLAYAASEAKNLSQLDPVPLALAISNLLGYWEAR